MINKAQKVRAFLSNVVSVEMEDFLEQLLAYVNENKQDIIEAIVHSFKMAYKATENLPENRRGAVEYVQFTLSRCDAMLRQDFYKVEMFDQNLYMGGYLCEASLDMAWMYREFFSFCDRISEKSKQYFGQIGKLELERIHLSALETCQKLLKYLIGKALKMIVETEEYDNLPAAAAFHLSSYRGPFQVLYVKDTQRDRWREYVNELLQNLSGQGASQPDTANITKS